MKKLAFEIVATIVLIAATVCALLFSSPFGFKGKGASSQNDPAGDSNGAKEMPTPKDAKKDHKEVDAKPVSPPKEKLKAIESMRSQIKKEIDTIQRPHGSRSFTGKVMDRKGNPIAGAQVTAQRQDRSSYHRFGKKNWWRMQNLDMKLEGYMDNFKTIERNKYSTVSDSEGRFAINELPDGKYYISVLAEGYDEDANNTNNRFVEPDAELTLFMKPIFEFKVLVLDPDCNPASSAKLRIDGQKTSGSYLRSIDWCPEDPMLELYDEGIYILSANDEENGTASDMLRVSVKAGDIPDEIVLRMEDVPGIKGRLIFEEIQSDDENAPGHYEVCLIQVPSGSERSWEFIRQGRQVHAASHNSFEYSFDRLVPGNYLLACMCDKTLSVEEVCVNGKTVRKDLKVPPLEKNNSVVVSVLDPSGKQLSDCQISIECRSTGASYRSPIASRRLPDGTYIVPIPEKSGGLKDASSPDKAEYVISVLSNSFGSKEVSFAIPPPERIVIQFDREAILDVLLTNYGRAGYEERLGFGIFPENQKNRSYSGGYNNASYVNSKGVVKLGPFQPGKYALIVFLKTDRWQYSQIGELSVELSPGENSFDIELPVLHVLSVSAAPEKAGAFVSIARENTSNQSGGFSSSISLDKEGAGVFRNLSAGDYTIIMGGKNTSVSIPDDKEIELE